MKFLLDNNLSPSWAQALHALAPGKLGGCTEVVHLRSKFPAATPDTEWLSALAKESGWAVLSGDGFKKSDVEKHLIMRAGLAVFVLAHTWQNHQHWEKTVQIIRWWPKIVEQANLAKTALRVPWNVSTKFESLRF